MKEPIRIAIADDHTILRQGLRALLEPETDMKIIGEADGGAEIIELAHTLRPDIIIMDIAMPGLNGIQATSQIRAAFPGMGIVILSMSAEEEFVDQAISAGVNAYLIKDTAAKELLMAIREVKRGNAYFSPVVSKILLERQRVAAEYLSPHDLTFREKQILQFIAGGKTSKEIGLLLHISSKTVDKHRQQIMGKLDIHEIAGLTRYALTKGLVT